MFSVDEKLVTAVEKSEQILFEVLPLKRTIDQWIAEIDNTELFGWRAHKDDDDMRLWYRKKGLDSAPEVPLTQTEYYFPDIEDPALINAAIVHFRKEFDLVSNETIEELTEFRNDNTSVMHIVGK